MAIRFTLAAGTAAEWAVSQLVLAVGQGGLETDTGKLRMGDGARLFPQLPLQIQSSDSSVSGMRALTQAAYDALPVKDPTTLYVVV